MLEALMLKTQLLAYGLSLAPNDPAYVADVIDEEMEQFKYQTITWHSVVRLHANLHARLS
jgi:nucleoside-specific outer membrane channel protein Tsx